ncbi:MAG TPA: hypothetical protein VMU67_02060 [Steroidobacteraceae bacterium]|nr:hypothetical protein [Steroidobacteraceae bacterium]
METVTIEATAQHGLAFSTLAALAIGLVVVGLIAWQIAVRARAQRGHDGH